MPCAHGWRDEIDCETCRPRANARKAATVCHDDQLEVWASEIMEAIEPWLAEFDSYDDKVLLAETLKHEARAIVGSAFDLMGKP